MNKQLYILSKIFSKKKVLDQFVPLPQIALTYVWMKNRDDGYDCSVVIEGHEELLVAGFRRLVKRKFNIR